MAGERAIANQLGRLLNAATHPVYALDDRHCITYLNNACADWVGIEAEQLLGQRCDYRSGESGDRIADAAAWLAPPPETYEGTSRRAVVASLLSNGATSRRTAHFHPLFGEVGEVAGVLAVLGVQELSSEEAARHAVARGESVALHQRLQELGHQLRAPFRLARLAGESAVMERVRQQVALAIKAHSHAQIVGPPGSGREFVARVIHSGDAPDVAGPLMPLVCSLLDAELLQATIVAFLSRAKHAAAEHPATLLLLDVHELSVEAQAELLAFCRVPTFQLRTIVTCRRPLLTLAEQNSFHAELACRLSGLVIELPALASRRQDIPLLCQQILEDFNGTGGKQLSGFTPSTLDHLCAMPWTGNAEELATEVREMCEHAEGPFVTEADFSRRIKHVTSAGKYPSPEEEVIDLDAFLLQVERELLERALAQAKGNKAQAARLISISRQRFVRRVDQLGVE